MADLNTAKQTLLAMRDDYTRRLEALDKDLHHKEEPVEKDFAEQVTQRENESVLEALDGDARELVGLINAALTRIEDGSYGLCKKCGEAIPENRLQAVPYTSLCVSCAEKLE